MPKTHHGPVEQFVDGEKADEFRGNPGSLSAVRSTPMENTRGLRGEWRRVAYLAGLALSAGMEPWGHSRIERRRVFDLAVSEVGRIHISREWDRIRRDKGVTI